MNKTKTKAWLTVLLVLVILAVGLVQIPKIWRDISFYWTEHTETELKVKHYAEEMGISYSAYPQSLIDLLERNPETEEFVLNYPFADTQDLEVFAPDLSEGVPLLMQWDPRWGYLTYGSDVVGLTGCGPLCLAMAGCYVTGDTETFAPANVVEFAKKNGYYSKGNGSSWTLISEGGVKLGLEVTELPLVKKRMTEQLEAGHPIMQGRLHRKRSLHRPGGPGGREIPGQRSQQLRQFPAPVVLRGDREPDPQHLGHSVITKPSRETGRLFVLIWGGRWTILKTKNERRDLEWNRYFPNAACVVICV